MVTDKSRWIDVVFEGGGVRGNALVGALAVLEERGYRIQNRAGTSAGAIVATLSAAGYKGRQLRTILGEQDFSEFIDLGWERFLPVAGIPLSVLVEHGIFEGDAFYEWLRALLEARDVESFGDLVHPEFADDGPLYRYKVQVIVSDLSGRQLLVLPRDAAKLGFDDPDEMEVALAVRMSMAIPLFFEPVRFRNRSTNETHVIVDGGVLSNYPVWLFDEEDEPEWPTIGLRLVEDDPETPVTVPDIHRIPAGPLGFVPYLKGLVATLLGAHDRLYIEQAQFARTIPIPTLGIRATDFLLTNEDAVALYRSGRAAARKFLDGRWDFAAYKREFRSGKEHERSQEMAELLSGA